MLEGLRGFFSSSCISAVSYGRTDGFFCSAEGTDILRSSSSLLTKRKRPTGIAAKTTYGSKLYR